MGFTREQLRSFEGATVEDLIGPDVRLLFVGINPGLWTAATNTHFCHPSNRFYPALREAGIIDWSFDMSLGMTDADRARLAGIGIAITNLVPRATARASQLDGAELRAGAARLVGLVADLEPRVVAILGVTAYRVAFGEPGAGLGRQPDTMGKAEVWVLPNPSGLNAHETSATLAKWFRAAADAAGVS